MIETVKMENRRKDKLIYWFDFGTLLGAVREHYFIKHDSDMDFGMMYSDHQLVPKAMASKGIKLFSQDIVENKRGILQKYIYKGIVFDIFFYEVSEEEKTMSCYSFYNVFKYRKCEKERIRGVKQVTLPYSGFRKIEFIGRYINVPKDTDNYLKVLYGENYMMPNPNFSHKTNPNRLQYIRQFDIEKVRGFMHMY